MQAPVKVEEADERLFADAATVERQLMPDRDGFLTRAINAANALIDRAEILPKVGEKFRSKDFIVSESSEAEQEKDLDQIPEL